MREINYLYYYLVKQCFHEIFAKTVKVNFRNIHTATLLGLLQHFFREIRNFEM